MYGSRMNTGAAYVASRGWDKEPSSNGSISFHGRSRKKIIVIVSLAILGLLLLAAIVIIILFATGVLNTQPIELPETTTSAIGPPMPQPARTYTCGFLILRQANNAYNEKSSNTFQYAFNMIQSSLSDVIGQSSLASRGATVTLTDLNNRGEDVQVDFLLRLLNPVDGSVVASVLRSQISALQSRLGGNPVIDPDSIRVSG